MVTPFWFWNFCAGIDETLVPSSQVSNAGAWTFGGDPLPTDTADATDNISDDNEGTITPQPTDDCPSTTNMVFIVHITNPTGVPGDSSCQGMRFHYRIAADADGNDGILCWALQCRLQQGTTTIDLEDQVKYDGDAILATFTKTLSDAEVDSITDHTDLRFRVRATVGLDTEFQKFGAVLICTGLELEYFKK